MCSGIHFLNQFECVWRRRGNRLCMPVWKCQTEIAVTLYWSKLQRDKFFWQDSFVFWVRYIKVVFGLWAKPSLLASCFALQEPLSTTSSWEEMGRLPAAPHLRHSCFSVGGRRSVRGEEALRKQCRVHKTCLPAAFILWSFWAVPMRRHLCPSPWVELLLPFIFP